jgi:hypothetical protein
MVILASENSACYMLPILSKLQGKTVHSQTREEVANHISSGVTVETLHDST